ncbi:hypothetical protein BDF14DRAFT_1766161 [Spinellus fusiger]|nr:hypothetical protein BDF14DRAFT_1766161 [Spinellus fusiger]
MELPYIGKHCTLTNCQSLDFLPVTCPLCHHAYCNDHRLPPDHACSEWSVIETQLLRCSLCQNLVRADSQSPESCLIEHQAANCTLHCYTQPSVPDAKLCAVSGCKDMDPRIGPVQCENCHQDHCLRHRHPTAHQCTKANPEEQRKEERKKTAQTLVAKTFTSVKKSPTGQATVSAKKKQNPVVEKMKIKTKAKGSASVPMSLRIYLYVHSPMELNKEPIPMFFDKTVRIGRLLDTIADMCQAPNNNHLLAVESGQRLELVNPESMAILDTSQCVKDVLADMDSVLLERKSNIV